ncbi:MAG: diadenylate cyclase CdaA [Lachnospiraceae bacterium]|nr:diadenylate cyclase CdaA [Lachnospiraceae bacterium]
MQQIQQILDTYFRRMPSLRWTDIAEIVIISFLVYHILVWVKNTKAWSLLKGVVVIAIFLIIAVIFNMTTILWIAQNVMGIAATVIIVILQPELRRALEELGRKNIIASIFPFDMGKMEVGFFSDRTINEITKACVEMGKVKTGALIVVEQHQSLAEYERTGIDIDGVVSSQLLINIFEHNTPLHDGAVIIRGNRVISATCYLPLSDNMALSKDLGTRHRAAVGISEATDSMTIIVSEETGKISVAYEGKLERSLSGDELKEKLYLVQNKPVEEKKRKIGKGREKNAKETD